MSNVKYVKKEEKKNNYINIGIIAVVVVIVLALAIVVSSNKGGKAVTGNNIIEISYSEYKEKIMGDDYTIVLLASPTCSHCQDYKPFMNGSW
jgi:thioredoxin-related protein